MQTEQLCWSPQTGWSPREAALKPNLVLVFGSPSAMSRDGAFEELRRLYPDAHLVGCSTAGEIAGTHVMDDSLVATAVRFKKAHVEVARVNLRDGQSNEDLGAALATKLPKDGLAHVLVFSDGTHVNGSSLVKGMLAKLPAGVQVTGGLAGDGARFQQTFVMADARAADRSVTAIGFYGADLHIGYGSLGGWDSFGPIRMVTKSKGNVLYELDGQPALTLYKRYLGEHAAALPAAGLLFPLNITSNGGPSLTRTILAVDEAAQTMTFAGDIPQGSRAQLMKANFDRLVDGAHGAAEQSRDLLGAGAELAILISCVGRKLVLKQRVEEELEAVQDVLGPKALLAGFYSYGEICPAAPRANCELHNQTMTITTLRET
ncbi:MAG: FIST N-terminal domain-containing protein [bacterium]